MKSAGAVLPWESTVLHSSRAPHEPVCPGAGLSWRALHGPVPPGWIGSLPSPEVSAQSPGFPGLPGGP